MPHLNKVSAYELIYVIVNYGMGSKVLHKAKEAGIESGTVFLGKGTVKNAILNFFSLYDIRKEIVLLGSDHQTASYVLNELNKYFQFEKPNHGIAYSMGACEILGTSCKRENNLEERGGINAMYKRIIVIVNRGNAEDVIEAAEAAGSKGGTILNARGAGAHETSKLFNMEIEPEKEIVVILAKEDITQGIVNSIKEKIEIDTPGNGIMFVQDIHQVYGVYE